MMYKGKNKIINQFFSPTKFLVMANLACTALSFMTGLVTARLIRPDFIGIAAVIAGIGSAITGFVDVRLWELAGKLFYNEALPPSINHYQFKASVLQVCIVAIGIQALILIVATISVSIFVIGYFTSSHVKMIWIISSAVIIGSTSLSNACTYLLRFSGRYYLIGILKILIQLFSMSVIIPFMVWKPNLDGYFIGRLLVAVVIVAIMLSIHTFVWGVKEGLPLFHRGTFMTWKYYLSEYRFLFYSNLMGYSKMLSRSFDVLLVGRFCGDQETGIYKIARILSDSVFTLFDAMNQVYYPQFLMLINKKMKTEYKRLAGKLVTLSAGVTVIIVALEVLLFPVIINYVLSPRYANLGLEGSTILMTTSFFVIAGIHIWVWPMFVFSGKLGIFTLNNFLACGMQYLVSGALFLTLPPSPLYGAIGMLAYYIFLGPAILFLAKRRFPDFIPTIINGKRKEAQ